MLDGVRKIALTEGVVYYIDQLTDAIKNAIRDRLTTICYGSINAQTDHLTFSYKATVKEFVSRYISNRDNITRIKGMVGELLFHLLMSFENEYCATSAFFNLEEGSFKKGFDLCFYNQNSQDLWIAEVKSGEKQAHQSDQSEAIVNLINHAKNDLKERLNDNSNRLWLNAINHARIAINDNKDEKKAIIKLLSDYSDQAQQGIYNSNDKNVIFVGVLFHTLMEEIEPDKVQAKHDREKESGLFNKILTIAIQKETYEAVICFLESEAKV